MSANMGRPIYHQKIEKIHGKKGKMKKIKYLDPLYFVIGLNLCERLTFPLHWSSSRLLFKIDALNFILQAGLSVDNLVLGTFSSTMKVPKTQSSSSAIKF